MTSTVVDVVFLAVWADSLEKIVLAGECWTLLCDVGNLGKIWFSCGRHEMQYIEWKMNKYTNNYMHNFTSVFVYISCRVTNILIIGITIYKKCSSLYTKMGLTFYSTLCCCFSIFLRSVYTSSWINSSRVFKIASAFFLGFDKERVKRCLLISSIPRGTYCLRGTVWSAVPWRVWGCGIS